MEILILSGLAVAVFVLGYTFGYSTTTLIIKDSVAAGMHVGMEIGANAVASQYAPEEQQQETTETKQALGFDLSNTKKKGN